MGEAVSWLLQYRAASGDTVSSAHDSREAACDALVDQLIESAMKMWEIGASIGANPWDGRRQEYNDRGDRLIHHACRLLDTEDSSYVVSLSGGRRWLLAEV